MQLPELLSPAGNLERLKIAILYGADAVYLAGDKYGLRGGADNFSDIEMQRGIAFAHERNAKVYAVLNAFPHDHEFDSLPEYVQRLEELQVDAIIASDLGVISVIRTHTNLPVHLSTQASCLNAEAAKAWKHHGVSRVIVGRELPIREAGLIRERAGVEVEMFIHGAMCMSYSGNCVISNYTAGRDSNRGGCVQSCRFNYTFQHPTTGESITTSLLSSQDLRGIQLLSEFMQHGIASLKIEGRMKSNLYVATTTRTYRKALKMVATEPPECWPEQLQQLAAELEKIPHRGYTEGSLRQLAGPESVYHGGRNGLQQYEITGTVLEVIGTEYTALFVQNAFNAGDTLEFLTFDGRTIYMDTSEVFDIRKQALPRTKPNSVVLLPFYPAIKELNLARRRKSHAQ